MGDSLSQTYKMTSQDEQELWVQHVAGDLTYGPTEVSVKGCKNVDMFKDRIKEEFAKTLAAYDAAQLTLYHLKDGQEIGIDVGDSPADYLDGNSRKNPLIVRAMGPATKPAISSTRHSDYKHSKAVHSSRSYLTSIALALEELYHIQKHSWREEDPPTFGDIIWNKRRNPPPKLSNHTIPLKEMLTEKQWNLLIELNKEVNGHLHFPLSDVNGTKTVILPLSLSHLSADFQAIAKQTKVVTKESDLIVKSEGSVSGGSPNSDKQLSSE